MARRPPDFAFMEMENPRDADDSVRGFDGTRICGTRVKVEMSNGRRKEGGGDEGDEEIEEVVEAEGVGEDGIGTAAPGDLPGAAPATFCP